MTGAQLAAKRDAILASIDVAKVQFGERSIQYGDRMKALAVIDSEIQAANEALGTNIKVHRVWTEKGL